MPVPPGVGKFPLPSRERGAHRARALAVAGLLLGGGCAAASPDLLDADSQAALLDAWLIPETEEAHDAPSSEDARDRGLGGGRFGLDDEFELSGGDDFIVLEGVPEPHEATPVAIRVTSVEALTVGGTGYADVYVESEAAQQDRIAGRFPLEPVPASAPAATTPGPAGLWVTGAAFYNWSDGGTHRGEGIWRAVAPGAVGDDGYSCAGPTADELMPHVYPECLALHLGDDSARHSPVYGFAADGYPVHGPWADLELPARSSWRIRDYETAGSATGCSEPGRRTCLLVNPLDPTAGTVRAPAPGPDPGEVPPGAFFEDYWFDIGLDDGSPHALDAFNGHAHDDIGYHHHITRIQNGDGSFTDVFPYILGPWFRGELHPGSVSPGGPKLPDTTRTTGTARIVEAEERPEAPGPTTEPPFACAPRLDLCD